MKRLTSRVHAAMYRLTSGRLLGRIGGLPVLLLETVGRRTGQRRRTPVQYLDEGRAFVIVASNAGAPHPPAWYSNLKATPNARVQIGKQTFDVDAREVSGPERAVLWERLVTANHYLDRAARRAGRELPLIKLTPKPPTTDRRP